MEESLRLGTCFTELARRLSSCRYRSGGGLRNDASNCPNEEKRENDKKGGATATRDIFSGAARNYKKSSYQLAFIAFRNVLSMSSVDSSMSRGIHNNSATIVVRTGRKALDTAVEITLGIITVIQMTVPESSFMISPYAEMVGSQAAAELLVICIKRNRKT